MAAFAGKDLKTWREMLKISAADLAERISCDASTIYKFESGKLKLNPDAMYEICDALGDVSRWCFWMRTEYPMSYGRVHPEIPQYDLSGALMSLYAAIGDLQDLEREALRDGANGKFDDPEIEMKMKQKLTDLVGRAQLLLNILTNDKEK